MRRVSTRMESRPPRNQQPPGRRDKRQTALSIHKFLCTHNWRGTRDSDWVMEYYSEVDTGEQTRQNNSDHNCQRGILSGVCKHVPHSPTTQSSLPSVLSFIPLVVKVKHSSRLSVGSLPLSQLPFVSLSGGNCTCLPPFSRHITGTWSDVLHSCKQKGRRCRKESRTKRATAIVTTAQCN